MEPRAHVTALIVVATAVTVVASTTPSLRGSFVGNHVDAAPVNGVAGATGANGGAGAALTDASGAAVTVAPVAQVQTGDVSLGPSDIAPSRTVVVSGPGEIPTVIYTQPTIGDTGELASPLASDGIPVTALEAYQSAANTVNAEDAGCHLPWALLAGIGRVESDHGRFGGAVLRPDGTSSHKIIGIPLNGNGTEVVTDTDHGAVDGDPVNDRAVGPMQFIPSTWAIFGVDGNGDGIADPFNIFDAAAASAHYLCEAGGDLSTTAGQTRAVLTYNHSTDYLNSVLSLERTYADGAPGLIIPPPPVVVPPVPGQGPGGTSVPPPADPGPPLGVHPKPQPGGSSTVPGATSVSGSSGGPASSGSSGSSGAGAPSGSASSSGTSGTSGSAGSPGAPGSPTHSGKPTSRPVGGSTSGSPAGGNSGSTSTAPSSGAPSSDVPSTDAPTSAAPSTDAPSSDAPTSNQPSCPATSSAAPPAGAPSAADAGAPGALTAAGQQAAADTAASADPNAVNGAAAADPAAAPAPACG